MRMQEVIAKLREEAPRLETCAKNVERTFQRMCGLLDDFRSAKSDEGRKILADAIGDEMGVFADEYRALWCSVDTVCKVNADYKEKLGPGRRRAKSKDAPGQQMLDLGDAPRVNETHDVDDGRVSAGVDVDVVDRGRASSTSDAIAVAVAEQGDRAAVTPGVTQSWRMKEP